MDCRWWRAFTVFDVLILSGDIRDQSRQLSKIAKKFGRFFLPSQIFGGGHCKSCAHFITLAGLASRDVDWKKSREDTPTIARKLLGRPEPPFRTGFRSGRAYVLPQMFSSFFRHEFSDVHRPIALKLCYMVGIWPNFIIPLQKFRERSPNKIWGQKRAKIRSILDHFRLWSRISPERLEISKIGRRYKLWQFLLRLTKKVRWTLVH